MVDKDFGKCKCNLNVCRNNKYEFLEYAFEIGFIDHSYILMRVIMQCSLLAACIFLHIH